MEIIITGGTGAIGRHLTRKLIPNHNVTIIGRDHKKIIDMFGSHVTALTWDELHKISNNTELVIHLAGHNIGNSLWTQKNMQLAFSSRINLANKIAEQLDKKNLNPRIIKASGITFYGFYKDCAEICTENTKPMEPSGKFAQDLAIACEQTFKNFQTTDLRIAPVLDPNNGIMPKLIIPAKFALSAVIGNGKQPFSWIAIEDLINAILYIIDKKELNGPINLASPDLQSQENFTKELGKVLMRPVLIKLPKSFIEKTLGAFGQQFLLSGQAVKPEKLLKNGFKFEFNEVKDWFTKYYN